MHLRERPTVMKRFVNGIMEEPIWQKRVPKNIPEWLQTATVAFPSGRTAEELVANDAAHLAWAVNLGVIDFNPWPARRDDLDHPDELRVDLDPTPGRRLGRGAQDRDGRPRRARRARAARLAEDVGLQGHPRQRAHRAASGTSLGVRRAALALAREVERRAPDLATSKWWKEERHGVFVDYNQNARDRTVASCYSVRPTPDARVSCALDWDEVPDVEPGDLRLDTVPDRLREVGDPAADIDEHAGTLDAAARPRPPRRGGRARRRALAAALPQAEGRAQARAAEPRSRPPDAHPSPAAPAIPSPAGRGGKHPEPQRRRSGPKPKRPAPARAGRRSSTTRRLVLPASAAKGGHRGRWFGAGRRSAKDKHPVLLLLCNS